MPLFKYSGLKVQQIASVDLDKERNLQILFEQNLDTILHITFLYHEFPTSFGGRIDTLGIDKSGAPCIIEYKRNQNDSVINQGLSYLRWLLDHKADFEALCNKHDVEMQVDWESPRVICVAESYNKFDLDTADLLPINVELLRYRLYEGGILFLEPERYQKVTIATGTLFKRSRQETTKTKRLQATFTIEDHTKGKPRAVIELFEALREKLLALDQDVREEPKANYIAYKLATNFVDVTIMNNNLLIYLNVKSGQLHDPNKIARDLIKPKKIGHWGNGDYDIRISDAATLDNAFELIKQSYQINK